MGRKVFKFGLILYGLCYISSLLAFEAVFDATNAGHLINILGETRRQYQELRGMSTRLENLNGRLGGILPGIETQRLSQLNNTAREWGHYIDALSSPGTDGLSLLSNIGFRNFGLSRTERLSAIAEFLSDKLYPSTQEPVSYQRLEEIKQVRTNAVKSSTVQGVALAGEKKHSLYATQRKIAEIGTDALRAPTLHDDLVITNKLLTLIAQELTQQRELLSHQLELISAVVAQGSPLVTKNLIDRNH